MSYDSIRREARGAWGPYPVTEIHERRRHDLRPWLERNPFTALALALFVFWLATVGAIYLVVTLR